MYFLKAKIHDQFKLTVLTDCEKTDRVNEKKLQKTVSLKLSVF